MEKDHSKSPTNRKLGWWWGFVALLTASLPWWRNHGFIRDFMDYGLVMAGAGRIGDGEAPYVDFVTPIQAGFLYLNRWMEVLGGGTFIGMTYGGLLLIVGGWFGLQHLLKPRVGILGAGAIAWVIIVSPSSQHTIIWHNTLGVFCIALVTWSAAMAPGLSKRSWILHLVMVGGLWLGGMNKVSFHLIAIFGALGFVVRAALLQHIDRRSLAQSITLIILTGVMLPIGTELFITGASFQQWSYNVLQLAGGSRAEYVTELLTWDFYLRPLHDYYGPLVIPQFGLITLILFGGIGCLGWKNRTSLDRAMILVAATGCALCVLLLLATNQEIAYISASAAVCLGTALFLGFGLQLPPRGNTVTLVLITIIFALPAWRSAWLGERVLFGHSASARSEYRILSEEDSAFSYLAGVRIPPESVDSYSVLVDLISPPNAQGQHRVFYGTGVEWLERVWPTEKHPGLPLWMHDGTSYGPSESQLLQRLVNLPSRFNQLVSSVPWDHWPGQAHVPIDEFAISRFCGSVLKLYEIPQIMAEDRLQLKLINTFKTNFEPRLLEFDEYTLLYTDETGRPLFGTTSEPISIKLNWKGSRARAEPILMRGSASPNAKVRAKFTIEYEVDGTWHHIWSENLELLPGEETITLQTVFDCRQRELRFRVELDASDYGKGLAGWFPPTLLDSQASPHLPPPLTHNASAVNPETDGIETALLATDWSPDQIYLRGGKASADGLVLSPGDQVWLRADHPLSALDGELRVDGNTTGKMPLVRILWYKAGRVQMAWQGTLDGNQPTRPFHAWSAGPEGWFGIIVDHQLKTAPVSVKITRTEQQN
ncbi:MAG: hypothetical protein ACKVI3_13485 [Verrucomicrobiia bacterium]